MAEMSDKGKLGIAVLVGIGFLGAAITSISAGFRNNPDQQPAPAPSAPSQAPAALPEPKSAPLVDLPALFGKPKSQVNKQLSSYKMTFKGHMPADYSDAMQAGGEMRTYDIGLGMELNLVFNRKGYAVLVG